MNKEEASGGRLFQRPIVQANEGFAWVPGEDDPAERIMIASETAWALLHRIRKQPSSEILARVINLAEKGGIDEIAELWSSSHAQTLPGVLWRLYLLREVITSSPEMVREIYRAGLIEVNTIDGVVAGVEEPITPDSLRNLSDEILRGLFVGDFASALDRAAAACMIFAAGAAHLADTRESDDEEEATRFTKQALRFDEFARDLRFASVNWRKGTFE